MNPDELAQLIVSEVKSYTARAVTDLETRLRSEFEERLKALPPALNGKDGINGVDGQKGDPGEIGPKGDPGAIGERGEKGIDGQDADLEIVRKEIRDEFVRVRAELETVVKAIPIPKDGRDGRDAKDGKDGKDGRDGITELQMDQAVRVAVAKELPLFVDPAVRESVTKALADYRLMTYKDVWRPDLTYEPGHAVSHGGSLWHCNTQTTVRPGEGSPDWTLAVKKGRDAKSPVVKA